DRAMRLYASALLAGLVAHAGCGGGQYLVRGRPTAPYDVAIVPGCPCDDDGSLSYCQRGRALWGAVLWRRGDAANLIVSGAAAHSSPTRPPCPPSIASSAARSTPCARAASRAGPRSTSVSAPPPAAPAARAACRRGSSTPTSACAACSAARRGSPPTRLRCRR